MQTDRLLPEAWHIISCACISCRSARHFSMFKSHQAESGIGSIARPLKAMPAPNIKPITTSEG